MIPIAPVKLSPVEPKSFLVESTNSKPLYDPFGKPLAESTIPDAQEFQL